jgi:hypothetical protein
MPNGQISNVLSNNNTFCFLLTLLKNQVNNEVNQQNKLSEITINDFTGRIITVQKTENTSAQKINVEALTAGIYFIECTLTSGKKKTGKF